ncbi:hypothetical protein F5B22DRAFT_139643 [Xylaria bambusicola]|uniref:uncharacterized protein n=1 Tax=Xylaria bambusicola TaxID=326684 RepID=UPI0020087092|nr:uncharacterized protein F5B22DRAFT_139643 [Xylaria bambusicola]KAI0516976.1 hypothetical protein F5B22DRAFT_139643 [Xylaria bambusicola]
MEAISSDRPRPELSTVNGYSRKFGRYDFKRFDHLVSSHASLGAASLGKIHVDCRFLFKKSKWGTLEGRDSAGIVYLDLAFSQPSDCRLKSATVQVTLDDHDEHLVREFPHPGSTTPVQIVKYGPRQMTGQPQYEQVTTHNRFIPSVEVGPFGGAGGVGRESAKVTVRECRWTFESHLMTGRKRGQDNWAYKVLQWQITENELEAQSSHNNVVHTAFSFVHGGQPFFMRVEVSGKLESRTSDLGHQIRHKMRKLKFASNPHNAKYATTLVNFNGRHRFTTPLDGLVQGLELAMEHENMTAPVEVRRAQQPTFFDDPPQAPVPQPSVVNNTSPQALLEEHEDPTAPTIENIASLSSRWLTAPPVIPLNPICNSNNDDSRRPVSTVYSTPPPSQHHDEHVSLMGESTESQNSNLASPQTELEQEGRALPTTSRFNSGQARSSAGQIDLGTVVFLMRIWMLQTLATLLGYGNNRPNQ